MSYGVNIVIKSVEQKSIGKTHILLLHTFLRSICMRNGVMVSYIIISNVKCTHIHFGLFSISCLWNALVYLVCLCSMLCVSLYFIVFFCSLSTTLLYLLSICCTWSPSIANCPSFPHTMWWRLYFLNVNRSDILL